MATRSSPVQAALLVVAAVLVLAAGCTGLPSGTEPSTTPSPPLSVTNATDRALDAERDYVFTESVPEDATKSGTGGVSTTDAQAVAATDEGRFVLVRFAFWYTQNTSEGQLHADGISRAAYFVTPNDTTRVSYPGHEMKGSGSRNATLSVGVVNAASSTRSVSLRVEAAGNDVYSTDTSIGARSAAHTPRLAVDHSEAQVVATVDGTTRQTTVQVPSPDEGLGQVTVFVAPDGTVVVTRTPRPV